MTSRMRSYHGLIVMWDKDRLPGESSFNRAFDLLVDIDGTGALLIGFPNGNLDTLFDGGSLVSIDATTTAEFIAAMERPSGPLEG